MQKIHEFLDCFGVFFVEKNTLDVIDGKFNAWSTCLEDLEI